MKNPDELMRKARRIMVDAAIAMTRLKGPMRRAVRLVLLEGKKPGEAARDRRVKRDRRVIHRALLKVRPKLAAVEEEVRKLSGR